MLSPDFLFEFTTGEAPQIIEGLPGFIPRGPMASNYGHYAPPPRQLMSRQPMSNPDITSAPDGTWDMAAPWSVPTSGDTHTYTFEGIDLMGFESSI